MTVLSSAPRPPSRRSVPAWVWPLVAFLLGALVWVAHEGRWDAESWRYPTAYRGDVFEVLARLKASAEGDIWPVRHQRIERLAAPFAADWNAYPTPEKVPLLLLGIIARATDVFVAANVGLMVAHALSAAVFCWVVRRWLRVRPEWALLGALLFASNYTIVHRGLAHFSFVFTWVVPWGLAACWLVARSSRLDWRRADAWLCLGAGAAMGAHNTYYLFFWLQLMGWAALAQWWGARRWVNLQVAGAAIAAATLSFLLVTFEYWFLDGAADAWPLLERSYGGTERYALKAVELFIPPPVHAWDWFAFLGQRYTRWSDWRGEEFLPYLGLVGIAGLAWLACAALPRLLRGRTMPGQALSAGWLLAFSNVGGLNNVAAFFGGLYLFRATNRVVVFLAALILVFVIVRLARLTARWRPAARWGLAVGLAGLGLADQLPRGESPERREAQRAMVRADRAFAAKAEEMLGDGAMVFQLPVMGFPEVTPPWRLGDYEHFRPYLTTQSLRFSYGEAKFHPRGQWQGEYADLPPAELAQRLEALGFAAIYIQRRGYEDRAESLLNELEEAGYTDLIQGTQGTQVLVLLRPGQPKGPPWAETLTCGRGWNRRPVNGVRWSYREAALLYHNPGTTPVEVSLRLEIEVPRRQHVTLAQAGEVLWREEDVRGPVEITVEKVRLEPGDNTLLLTGTETARDGRGIRMLGLRSTRVWRPE